MPENHGKCIMQEAPPCTPHPDRSVQRWATLSQNTGSMCFSITPQLPLDLSDIKKSLKIEGSAFSPNAKA